MKHELKKKNWGTKKGSFYCTLGDPKKTPNPKKYSYLQQRPLNYSYNSNEQFSLSNPQVL